MLQYTVVIGRKTNTAGTQVNIDSLEITLHKSEELDFGVLTIPATTRFENFQILDRVDITVTDGETTTVYDPFLIVGDEVTPVSKLGYYKHTITFIEDIHKFDKILSSSIFITQPLQGEKKTLLDVMNHIRDVVPFERSSVHSATRLFAIDNVLSTFLDGIEAPQFFFTSMNLREMINAVASYVNAIGRLEADNNLVFSFYNEIFETLGINTDVVHRQLSNQTKYFTSSIESSIENAVSGDSNERAVVSYPNEDSWITPRANNLKLTDTNFEYRLPYPIETITQVLLRGELALEYYEYDITGFVPVVSDDAIIRDPVTDLYYRQIGDTTYEQIVEGEAVGEIKVLETNFTTNGASGNFIRLYWNVDVTDQVLIKEQWDRLDVDANTVADRRIQSLQINTLHYNIGGTTVSNSQLGGIFSGINALTAFFQRALYFYGFEVSALNSPAIISDFQLRFYYIPYFGTRIRMNKDDVTDHPYNTQMSMNQGERIVSAERLLRNIYGMAQRLGQDEIQFKRYYTDLSEVFPLGAVTEDNFVIASLQLNYNLQYVLVTYLLSKNFNRFANRIALNQENRPFDISLGSKTINRNLLYNEYVELDTQPRSHTSLVRRSGMKTFINTFRSTPLEADNRPIRYGVFKSPELVDVNYSNQGIFLKTISFAEGNSLNYYWSFNDVLTAGDQIEAESYFDESGDEILNIPIVRNRKVRYTDTNGKLDEFELHLAHALPETDGKDFPIVPFVGADERFVGGTDSFIVNKDAAESLSMNYQISVVPNYKYNNVIVVGREMIFSNNLILTKQSKTLRVYLSANEKYNSLETRYVKGTVSAIEPAVTFTDNALESAIVLSVSADIPNLNTYSSWGIGDEDGNLYLGVNVDEDLIDEVFFNFVNKREKLSYTFDDVVVSPVIAPSNLVLTPTETTITATWDYDISVDYFEIGIRNLTIPGQVFQNFPTNDKFYLFQNLVTGHEYQIRVRAVIGSVPSGYITRETFTTQTPSKVQNLLVSKSTDTTLLADWDDLINETGYDVEFSRPDGIIVEEYPTLQNSTALFVNLVSFEFGNRVSNRIAVFRVRGFNTFGVGQFSDPVIGVIPDFTWIGSSAVSNTVIDVEWDELPNVQPQSNQEIGYEITYRKFSQVTTGTTTVGGINEITDDTKSFNEDSLVGDYIYFTSGVREGSSSVITGNTATTIVFEDAIATNPSQLQGVDYRIESIGDSPLPIPVDPPVTIEVSDYTTTSTSITNLVSDTLYFVSIKAYYEYTITSERKYSDILSDVSLTLEEPVIAQVIQPTVTTRTGYPTTDSLGWTIFNPNDFDVRLLATVSTSQDPTPTVEYTTIGPSLSANLTFGGFDYSTTRILSVRFRVGTSPNFVFSNTVYNSQTTLPEPPPPPLATPTGLTVLGVTSNAVTVGWNPVSGATEGYDLNLQTSTGANIETGFAKANETTWDYALLNPETSYQVRIRAKATDTNSASEYSSFVPFTTLAGAPPRPTSLALSQTSSSSLSASWAIVSSATSYDFQLANDSGFTSIVSNQPNIAGTSTTVSGLFPGTYYGRVRAKNNNGDSDWRTASITMTA